MRKLTLMWLCLLLAAPAFAQDEAQGPAESGEEEAPEGAEADSEGTAEAEAEADSEGTTEAEADSEGTTEAEVEPELEPEPEPQLEINPESLELDELDDDADDSDEVTNDAVDLLAESEPPSSDPTVALPTTPQPIFGLHGYFRTRGEVYDNFFLGDDGYLDPGTGLQQFSGKRAAFRYFRPINRGVVPDGGCGDGAMSACDTDRLSFANMRLRLAPTISLSDDVQVHMMIDAFDNLVLGSTPDSIAYTPPGGGGGGGQFTNPSRTPGVPIDSFVSTQNPSQALRNSGRDSIYVRRAWASVRNRDLGQLRFGRMGSHWGLGMLANGGDGIDSDFSSDVDRVMAVTKLFGIYAIAAYDFAAQGQTNQLINDLRGVPFDLTGQDDVRQYVFALARREEERSAAERLASGGWVMEGGLYYVFRSQFLSSAGTNDPFSTTDIPFVRRDARAHIPDLWARFRMGGLRLELEAAAIIGEIGNINVDDFNDDPYRLLQFGIAFEGEYRMLDDKLSLRLYTGYATGDADVDGLSSRGGLLTQENGNRTVSNFNFHPNYRIDLILWRNIMERVSGAWYLRPGVSYDLIKSPFGRLFGASVDFIYSRAAQEVQTYGSDPNLGFEIDVSLYYRSEDGPEMFDGFYGMFQYGVLFPLAGLGYDPLRPNGSELSTAQSLRLVLGVQY